MLEALYAFEATVRDAVRSTAHEAAHTQLQWWRGELDRWLAGKPQHPITIALASLIPGAANDASLLHEALTAADLDLAHMTYGTERELAAYLFRASGALQTVAARALTGGRDLSDGEREFARRLGSGIRQVEMIRDLERDVRDGRLYVPLAELEQVRVASTEVAVRLESAELSNLVDRWIARTATEFGSLPSLLTSEQRVIQRSGLVLGALYEKLLARLRANGPAERATVEVPPLQRLWTAWRTALRNS